jgi:hypothetical protein
MMPKIGKCSKCGRVKTIYSRGLCKICYKRMWYRLKHPLKPIICSCGCGKRLTRTRSSQKFIDAKHKCRFLNRFLVRKYLGIFYCLKCGKLGYASSFYYKNTMIRCLLFLHCKPRKLCFFSLV